MYENNMPSPEDILGGGGNGIPSAKFPSIGTKVSGKVLSQTAMQQREFSANGPGKPLFWDDGSPRMMIVVTIDTDGTDDGQRRVFIKGQMLKAAKAALAKAGMSSFSPGSHMSVEYVRDQKTPNGFKAKQYAVEVSKGDPVADALAAEPAEKPAVPTEKVKDLSPEATEALRKAGLL